MVSFGILHILILWTSYEKEVCMYSHHITLHGEMPFDVYVYIYIHTLNMIYACHVVHVYCTVRHTWDVRLTYCIYSYFAYDDSNVRILSAIHNT